MEPAQPCFWMMDKDGDAYRTISEAAEELDLPQHVLRFWETRFSQIRPMKRGGGRRYYRPDDLDLLRAIRHLLYDEGYTIKGVQRMLKEQGVRATVQLVASGAARAGGASGRQSESRGPADGASDSPDDEGASHWTERMEPTFGDPLRSESPRMDPSRIDPTQGIAAQPLFGSADRIAPVSVGGGAKFSRGLSDAQTEKLEAVLDELEECRRILAAAIA